jgi:GrpB-like predicted nucleotidyltransferase (UPF0157 family)
MARVIEIVEYDANWAQSYAKEEALLRPLFGSRLVEIHHVGSTAVPGLAAKPIIDVLVMLDETRTVQRFYEPMRELGYRPRGECLDAPVPGTPGRFYFTKNAGEDVRTHQVHVCTSEHVDAADKLVFRDYLRSHPQVAMDYARVKTQVAAENHFDSFGYMRGKDQKVKEILAAAWAWRDRDGLGVLRHRPATVDDLDVLAIWNSELIEDERHRNAMTVVQLRERMRSWVNHEYAAVVFFADDVPSAYALYKESPDEILLRQFFVKRQRRRRGLGRQSIELLRRHVWRERKRVLLDVLSHNVEAVDVGRRDDRMSVPQNQSI